MAQQIDIVANLLMKVDGAEAGINKLKSSLSKLKMPEGLENSFKKSFSNLDTIFAKYRSQVEKGFNTKGDVSAFSKTSKELDAELNRISRHFTELTGKQIDFKVKSDSIVKAEKDLQNLITQKEKLGKDTLQFKIDSGKSKSDIESLLKTFKEIAGVSTNAGKAANNVLGGLGRGDITSTLNAAKQLEQAYQRLGSKKKDLFSSTTGLDMGTVVTALITQLTGVENKFKVVDGEIKIATQDLARFKADQIGDAASQVEKLSNSFEQNKSAINQANGAMQDYARSSQSMSQQLGDLQQSTQYFFSLRNMINLFKRGIDSAVDSVKQLDKAMTDTAVVTDYSVSDMWGMLPEYTKLANELGATTQGAYETMTLYFQQGLDQTQAFEIGAETMKMARIAGLDYAKTTDMMTAALRGFNMELNEASAKRINDVYSELAARTASDTEEIGEAMERTASIAHSAGMSFEGTSAFLAQMIETTREAPENLGTAMKTIIARFQELKKNPLEMQEIDGEEVSFNKVDTALQTIGVSLRDTNGQFRELDKVFLDIAQRWDGLTQTQQRYIATTAAGSRQQSRFIAMMSNYARTTELMSYANDSAGASQEQFEKTLDSLESKLNQLHNAWQQFTMGIANNKMIKGAVDLLADGLGIINKLIDTLSLGSGTIKSLLSLFTAFTGLKAGGKIINALIGGLGGMLDPSIGFGKGFFGGASRIRQNSGTTQAKAISDPIVSVLNQILGVISSGTLGQTSKGGPANYKDYKEANTSFRAIAKQPNATVGGVLSSLSKLDGQQVQSIIKSNPGITAQLQRSLVGSDLGKVVGRQLIAGLKQGAIDGSQLQKINKGTLGTILGTKEAEAYSQTFKEKMPRLFDAQLKQARGEMWHSADRNIQQLAAETIGKSHNDLMRQFDYNKETGEKIENPLYNKKYADYMKGQLKQIQEYNKQQSQMGGIPLEESKRADRLAEGIGRIGSAAMTAGQGCMALGNTLKSMGFEAAGNAATSFGSALSNLGMIINGLPSLITALGNPAVLAGTLAVGAIAAATVAYQNYIQKIKDNAEKITTDFKDKNEKHQTNVNNLESYREDFARLSAGVDQNGMNVSLDTSDYDRYLQIVDDIAAINPEIVEGYNAQGHAIINNNKALQETLDLEKKRQKDAFNTYIDDDSTEALQKARDLQKVGKYIDERGNYQPGNKFYDSERKTDGYEFKPQTEMRKNAQQIGKTLQEGIRKGWATKDLLSDFNIDIEQLAKGDNAAIQAFEQNMGKIQSRISSTMDAAGDDIKDKTKEKMTNAFSGYKEASDELDELITPMYEQMSAKMSQSPLVTQIPDEMRTYFNQGLKDIVSDANIKDVDKAANELAAHFSAFTSEGSDYAKVMDQVAKAQDAYAVSLDAGAYEQAANDATSAIEQMRQKLVDEGVDLETGYGKALSEFLDNEINKIRDFTEEGAANLSQALNTMTDEIAAAEGALENFNSVAEGSNYSTASSNLAKIYEEATSDVHTAGLGDQTFWTGAEALVGREDLKGKTQAEAQEMMSSVNEMLKGGQEGWDNFKIRWFDSVEAMGGKLVDTNGDIIKGITYDENGWFKTLDENINPQVYEQVAEALDMSKDSLVAMLNLGRQFGEVDFSNIDEARKALSTSDAVIAGNSTDKNGNRSLWIKENSLYSELAQAGITDINAQEEKIAELAERNVNVISKAGEMTIDQFQDMGIKSMDSLIDIFDSTGQFTKDEMAEYAEQWAELNNLDYDPSEFNEKFNEHLNELENGEAVKQTNELSNLNSTTSSIESILASMRIEEGHLDNPQADQLKQDILGGKGADTIAQLFSLGKNEKGQELTKTEYDATRKELVASQQSITNYLKTLQDNRNKAQGEERDKFDTEIANVSKYLDFLNKYIESGDAAWKQKEQERAQAEAEKNAIKNQAEAENEKYKQRAENSNQVESGDFSQAQQQLQTMMNDGFTNLFSSIDPQQMMTPEVASAIGTLYNSYLTQGAQQATPQIQQALSTLGISLEDAIKAGLIIDEPGLASTAQSEYEGASEGAKDALKGAIDTAKTAAEGADSAASETSSSLSSLSGEIASSVENFASSINNITLPALKTPEITPTITQGMGVVSNVANEVVAATLKVDKTQADQDLQETKAIAEQTAQTVSQGATFTIKTPGLQNLTKASTAAKKLNAAQGSTSFNVSANVSGTSQIQGFNTAAKAASGLSNKTVNYTAVVSGTSSVWNAVSAGNSFESLRDHKVTYTTEYKQIGNPGPYTGGYITSTGVLYRAKGGIAEHPAYPKKGTDRIPAYLTPGEYVQNRKAVQYFGIDFMRKINHKDLIGALQSFGSVAKGRYGRLGPNGKGGLTLTGEEGFEVGWIPSENRSVILGANGPQMVDLPSDTIIWDHKQSKKIISQNVIPAGSHYTTSKGAVDPRKTKTTSTGNGGGGGGGGGQDSATIKQNADNAKNASKVIKDAGWVTVWWENMTRRVDSTQRKIDNLSAKFDKQIKTFGTTVTSIQSTIKGYRNNLNQSISLNRAELKQAKKELKMLDAGGNFYSRKEVSYEETNGDKKESKKMTVSLGNYIKYNKKYGTYEIDQNQIDQVGLRGWKDGSGKQHGGNKSLAEAIKQAAEKEINDRNSKIKTAEDNIKKAQEALEKVSNDVYETFYGWEKSINRVYLLSKKLETITQQLSVTNAKLDLQFNKIAAGAINAAGAQAKINEALIQQRNGLLNKANASKQNLSATKSEFQNSLSLQPYLRNYLKNPNSTTARNDYVAAKKTFAFLDKVNLSGNNFNYTEALKYLNNAGMSKDEYDAIKNNLDKIFEKQNNYLQAQETAQQSISEIYQTMEEYQSFIADFEADLLTGMEEEAENQIQHLEKLNSSLTKALKDLLDEVKNRLDQRRKQEDNKKTESDLSQKQQRLTMLRADTGGGHAVEIAQLEKELAEAQQNYQRTLEDQLLERLQQQGDIAEKQRQHQIDLLSIQNQIAKETGTNLAQVKEWMNNPEKYYEQIRAAWLENQHYDEVAPNEQKNLEEQFEQNFAKFRGYKEQLDKYDEMIGQLDTLENDVNRIATEISLNKPERTAADMKARGYSAKSLRKGNFSALELLKAGYTDKQIRQGGYTAKQMKDALIANGASNAQAISRMRKAGYSNDDIAKVFSASSLLKAGYSGAKIQKNQNLSAKTIQDRINKNIDNPNVSQKDMAGVKVKIDTNEKDKGGIAEGTVTAGGKWIYANTGSTLHGQQLDTKTGQGVGKVHHVPIDQLTTKHFASNKKEATEALVYAITHQAWGSKINSNFSALVKAAGIKGKQYTLTTTGHNWPASVGGDGLIYQNVENGVAKWNPATGKTWVEKYNKDNFLKIAKRNNGVSREYAQVLINKKAFTKKKLQKQGVKQFLTGGLANYTGPAWLDGTPSKPELVLNAQDTKNFIALKDVLSKAMSSTGSVSNEYSGNATYEININVDHLNNDYDVDKVVERVKKKIVQDSGYRNVTQVRKFR